MELEREDEVVSGLDDEGCDSSINYAINNNNINASEGLYETRNLSIYLRVL